MWKADEGEAEIIVLLIFVLWGEVEQIVYSGPAEITSFSRWDVNPSNKHDTFWHVASTGYIYVLYLWAMSVSNFRPLEIYENLGIPLSAITFTGNNSQADNHFYKYVCLHFYK